MDDAKDRGIMHDTNGRRMGRIRKIVSGLSDIDSLVVNISFI